MRTLTLPAVLTLTLLGAAMPAHAQDDTGVTREEVERKKEEVRELERKLREQESAAEAERIQDELRRRRESRGDDDYYGDRRRRDSGRMWLGVGTGVGYAHAEVTCSGGGFGAECSEEGLVNTYAANLTLSSPRGLTARLRGLRDTDKGDDVHTPYEVAALVGTRFGRSGWYGMAGYGRIYHPDDRFPRNHTGGLAWEILFAPATDGPVGLELGFQGNNGHYVDYVAFTIGMRFGALN
jgi:hypothetical protein